MHAVSLNQNPKRCSEKAEWLRAYQEAVAEFSRTVSVLNDRIGVMPKAEYERVRSLSEKARRKADQARHNLENHVREHGC